MKLTRRDMLKTGIAATATGMFAFTSSAFAAFKDIPACLQLYSIGGVGDDPPMRMAKLAAMGYKGVEYAGFGGYSAKELRKFQDDAGLFCNGSHTGRDGTENLDNLKNTLDFHKELGAKFIICPGMGNDGIDGWKKAGESFAKAAEVAKSYGIYVGYHAHQPDFDIIDEKNNLSSWEIFADASGNDVMLQIDLGHCVNKGADPYALIEKYPGRSKTTHIKESDGKIIGEGRVDWIRALTLLESVGGAETYTIEYEADLDRMEAVRLDLEAFNHIRKINS